MQVSEVWIELCASLGAPTAVVVLALAVASRFYGLFLREGIAQRCLIAFLHEDPFAPQKLLNGIRFNLDNEPILVSGRNDLCQQLDGFEDDLILLQFGPSLAVRRVLENAMDSLESNLARQPAFRSVVAASFEVIPEELSFCTVVVADLKGFSSDFSGLSVLLEEMETAVQFNEARFHDVLEDFSSSGDPSTEWLFAAIHFAASFSEEPGKSEAELTSNLKRAFQKSEELLETEGLSQLFIEKLYKFCSSMQGVMFSLSSELNEATEARESIFYTDDYYFIPDEVFSEVCNQIPGIIKSQINRALVSDGIQVAEKSTGKVKYTQGRFIRVNGVPHKFRFHKLTRSTIDRNSFETLLWVSTGEDEG